MGLQIEPKDVPARIRAGAFLLDVRERDEWEASHVEGATLIPLDELEVRMAELPLDREVICMCRSGRRSAEAQELIERTRCHAPAYNMAGGILRWAESGLPVVGEKPVKPCP
ncbi:MAG: rhodanese-like domain-containing protein [Vulcanimicrobiaceae bacterium]